MKGDVRKFSLKLAILALPFAAFLAAALLSDPLKVWFPHDEYYAGNFVTLNRGLVCLRLFEKNAAATPYDSFILGNSRSLAFRVDEWTRHLPPGATGFHFDASGEGIFGIHGKLKYLDARGVPLRHVLIVLDASVLAFTANNPGYLFIAPPEISGESPLAFYQEFLKANLNTQFMLGFLDYSVFHQYRDYMKALFNNSTYPSVSDNRSGDLRYGYDRMIAEDQAGYYERLVKDGTFYDRGTAAPVAELPVTDAERRHLAGIRALFDKHRTDFHIVVSPLYDQRALGAERLKLLTDTFGTDRVHDFSGRNAYTESIHNYYEASHYRPQVANDIMDRIYSGQAPDSPSNEAPGPARPAQP